MSNPFPSSSFAYKKEAIVRSVEKTTAFTTESIPSARILVFRSHELDQVHNPVGITPFVIVPGKNLDHISTHNISRQSVDDGRMRVPFEVSRNQWFFGHIQILVQSGALGGFFQGVVDVFFGYGLAQFNHQIDNRNHRRRDADGQTIQLALQMRQNQANGFGGSSGSRNHVQAGGTG